MLSLAVIIAVCIMIGYAFGCVSVAYIVGRINKIDIREHGSGNAGTTNVMRVLGKQAGIVVYIGDCIKCVLAIVVAICVFAFGFKDDSINITLVKLVTGFGVVLGHNYPFWLKFKGGKGIAVTSAVILTVCLPEHWICPIIAIGSFALIVKLTRYVSLGSLMLVFIFSAYVVIALRSETNHTTMTVFAFLFAVSAIFSHKSNIKRLLNGTENKVSKKKKKY